mgnify:CR=1 FL=1
MTIIMTTYISILRGINVSGQKLIKMDDLRKMYEILGFRNVTTYVQSGNVIFNGDHFELSDLEQRISKQIQNDFGFEVPVIVLTIDKLKQIIYNNLHLHHVVSLLRAFRSLHFRLSSRKRFETRLLLMI